MKEKVEGAVNLDNTDSDDDDEEASSAVLNLIRKATDLKAKGNDAFKGGELGSATTAYEGAIERLTSEAAKKALGVWWQNNPLADDTATPLLVTCYSNLAMCRVKNQQWEAAVKAADSCLKLEPSNVKARFRRGVAESNTGRYDEAKVDLTAVIRADPKNREARTILEVVNAAIKERQTAEKAAAQKAFAGKGLYADEEAKRLKAAKDAADAKAAAEAAELREWRDECDHLRARVRGPKPTTDKLKAEAEAVGGAAEGELELWTLGFLGVGGRAPASLTRALRSPLSRPCSVVIISVLLLPGGPRCSRRARQARPYHPQGVPRSQAQSGGEAGG